jgi:hypothetical protein
MAGELVFLNDRGRRGGACPKLAPPPRGRAARLQSQGVDGPASRPFASGARFASSFEVGGRWTSAVAFASAFTARKFVAPFGSGGNFRSEFNLGGGTLASGRYRR